MRPALFLASLLASSLALVGDLHAQSTASAVPAALSSFDALFGAAPSVETLPNGLRIVTVPWASPGIVAYYTLVRAGSRDEVEAGHTGFAHFFEHMMFRGTEAHPSADYSARLTAVGADGNAYTTSDYTCYTIVAPSDALPLLVELEADRFRNLAYAEPAFRTEAGAVRGEYQVASSDPSQPMFEALSEAAFSAHTYRHTTIGYLADVDAMPGYYEYSLGFFRRYYTPDDTTLIVVGDFDASTLMNEVRARYGAWRGRRARPEVPTEPEPTAGGRRDLTWSAPTSPQLYAGYRVPAFAGSARRPTATTTAAAVRESAALQLVYLYAFSESAPLHQRLVVSEQRLLTLGTGLGEQSRDPGLFMLSAALAPAEGPPAFDDILLAIQGELDAIGRGEIDVTRLENARRHLLGSFPMSLETPASAANFLASYLAVATDLDVVRAYFAALRDVSAADVQSVVSRYLTPSRRFVVTMSPPAPASAGGAS